MAMFPTYLHNNQILIFIQRPDARRVAGFRTWKRLGRHVKKGANGIAILAPCVYGKKAETENEDSTACSTIRKNGPVTTGATSPCSRNALLDKSGTKIAIYQATLRAGDSFAQAGVWDILASNEPNHPLGQEYLHSGFITL